MIAGQEFTAQGIRWKVYEVRPDGVVCSRPMAKTTIDYTATCAHFAKSGPFRSRCDEYVVSGTRYCRKHQFAPKYYVD